ncbi:sigma factor [Pedobacter rhizosphaerae]|uniref:sigma factor n=1 Tax=Pedobacter rhizosphaerae TaxID=390241 RepID=UPI0021D3066D|nr:sigma factor [Pedobacter rhizosphaerae]
MFRNYHRYVLAFSRKITRSDDLAKEIVQDVFLKIWLSREKLRNSSNCSFLYEGCTQKA